MTLADRMVVMKAGVVQQFGTPEECYGRPANRFVAGFVGMPVMNFVDGRAEGGAFEGGGLRLALPASRWPSAPAGPVALGVRPDQLRVSADAAGAAVRIALYSTSSAETVDISSRFVMVSAPFVICQARAGVVASTPTCT